MEPERLAACGLGSGHAVGKIGCFLCGSLVGQLGIIEGELSRGWQLFALMQWTGKTLQNHWVCLLSGKMVRCLFLLGGQAEEQQARQGPVPCWVDPVSWTEPWVWRGPHQNGHFMLISCCLHPASAWSQGSFYTRRDYSPKVPKSKLRHCSVCLTCKGLFQCIRFGLKLDFVHQQ